MFCRLLLRSRFATQETASCSRSLKKQVWEGAIAFQAKSRSPIVGLRISKCKVQRKKCKGRIFHTFNSLRKYFALKFCPLPSKRGKWTGTLSFSSLHSALVSAKNEGLERKYSALCALHLEALSAFYSQKLSAFLQSTVGSGKAFVSIHCTANLKIIFTNASPLLAKQQQVTADH